jgi:hypothetical protein
MDSILYGLLEDDSEDGPLGVSSPEQMEESSRRLISELEPIFRAIGSSDQARILSDPINLSIIRRAKWIVRRELDPSMSAEPFIPVDAEWFVAVGSEIRGICNLHSVSSPIRQEFLKRTMGRVYGYIEAIPRDHEGLRVSRVVENPLSKIEEITGLIARAKRFVSRNIWLDLMYRMYDLIEQLYTGKPTVVVGVRLFWMHDDVRECVDQLRLEYEKKGSRDRMRDLISGGILMRIADRHPFIIEPTGNSTGSSVVDFLDVAEALCANRLLTVSDAEFLLHEALRAFWSLGTPLETSIPSSDPDSTAASFWKEFKEFWRGRGDVSDGPFDSGVALWNAKAQEAEFMNRFDAYLYRFEDYVPYELRVAHWETTSSVSEVISRLDPIMVRVCSSWDAWYGFDEAHLGCLMSDNATISALAELRSIVWEFNSPGDVGLYNPTPDIGLPGIFARKPLPAFINGLRRIAMMSTSTAPGIIRMQTVLDETLEDIHELINIFSRYSSAIVRFHAREIRLVSDPLSEINQITTSVVASVAFCRAIFYRHAPVETCAFFAEQLRRLYELVEQVRFRRKEQTAVVARLVWQHEHPGLLRHLKLLVNYRERWPLMESDYIPMDELIEKMYYIRRTLADRNGCDRPEEDTDISSMDLWGLMDEYLSLARPIIACQFYFSPQEVEAFFFSTSRLLSWAYAYDASQVSSEVSMMGQSDVSTCSSW